MLKVKANNDPAGELSYNPKDREYIFNYTHNNPISLTMPYQQKSYLYNLHPIFDMSMPEGYLFSLLKNLLIKEDGDENLFSRLVEYFLNQSAIAGVQPKVLARLQDKATLSTKEYIVKSFSDEYPHLAENEFFCMKALSYVKIRVPKFWLSNSKKLNIVTLFTKLIGLERGL